jgi:anthranilate phosphoribosyltransferase
MRMKGETVGEIAALARGMREHAKAIRPKVTGRIVDTCGTGGDGLGTFNISTASMFVASGAGVPVAKHGNRSVSSRCGSADVLEHLGARLDLTPPEVEEVMERAGICFMFAPVFHPAMKHALGPRREMGIRTVFNILGPLTNPCDAKGHVLGVYDASLTEKIAHVAAELGLERAFVVHGLDGQDEISTTGPTLISELADGTVSSYELTPDSLGIEPTVLDELKGGSVEVNARIMLDVLSGRELGARRDAVVANGAAAIASSRESGGIADAMDDARGSIDTGKALQRLIRFVQATGGSTDVITELLEAPM